MNKRKHSPHSDTSSEISIPDEKSKPQNQSLTQDPTPEGTSTTSSSRHHHHHHHKHHHHKHGHHRHHHVEEVEVTSASKAVASGTVDAASDYRSLEREATWNNVPDDLAQVL